MPREYDLDVFRIQPAFVYSPRLLSRVPPRQIRYPSGWTPPGGNRPRRQTFVHEAEFGFHPEVLDLTPPNLYLDGYWQSESYFAEAQEQIGRRSSFGSLWRALHASWHKPSQT